MFARLLERLPGAKARPEKRARPSAPPEDLKAPFPNRNLVAQLPHAEPEDGVVFLRGGGKVWYGIEITCPSAITVNAAQARTLAEGIRVMLNQGIPQETGGRLIIERVPAQKRLIDHFYQQPLSDDRLLSAMQQSEREDVYQARLKGQVVVTRLFLTAYLNVPKRPKNLALREEEYRAQLATARQKRTEIMGRLQVLGLSPAIMSNLEVKRLMHRYLNGNMASSDPPAFSSRLDLRQIDLDEVRQNRSMAAQTTRYQVASTEIGTSHPGWLTMEDKLISAVSLAAGGSGTLPTMIDDLLQQMRAEHFYLMLDFEHLLQSDKKAKLDTAISELEGFLNSPIAKIGANTAAKAATAKSAAEAAELYRMHFWRVGLTTVVYANNREHLRELNDKIRSLYATIGGAHAIVSNEQLKKTFFQNMPFSETLTRHRVSAMCQNIADLFPKISPWIGTPNPVLTLRNRHGSLTGLNFKEGTSNYGVMVIGKSGGGKSVWNMNMLLTYVPIGYGAFVMDPKHDYEETIYSLGGQVIRIAPDARLPDGRPVRINIFDPTVGEMMPGPEKVAYITAIMRVLEIVQTATDKAVLEAALQQFFISKARKVNVPGQSTPQLVYTGGRLREFAAALGSLQQIGDEGIGNKPDFIESRNRMAALLQQYIAGNGGQLSDFLDGETTVNVTSSCVCFDVEEMLRTTDPMLQGLAVLICAEYMFQLTARTKGGKLGIFEELGVLAGIPELEKLVNRWFKTGRSMGMIPIGTSQEPRDFERLGGIINNSSWIIMTALGEEEIQSLQRSAHLPEHVLTLARTLGLQPGVMGEYLVMQKHTDNQYIGDVVQLYLSPEKLWTVTTTKEQKDLRHEYTQKYGSRTEAILELAALTRRRKTI